MHSLFYFGQILPLSFLIENVLFVCFQSKQDYIQGQAQEIYVWTSAELKSFSWCFPVSVLIVSTAQAQQGPLVVSLGVLLRKFNANIKSIHM